MKNDHIFWIGIQESEIIHTGELFSGSITMFGSGKNNNYAFDKTYDLRYDYNYDNDLWVEFVNSSAQKIVQHYPDCAFMLYYPMDAVFYDKTITMRSVGSNDAGALDLWDNKFRCREWLGNDVPTVPSEVCYGEKIIAESKNKLYDGKNFVVQGEYSCGGSETWLLTEKSRHSVLTKLKPNKLYSISPYIEYNISINIHLIIYQDEVLLLSPSVQLITIDSYSFEYKGADFITYRYISDDIKEKIKHYSVIIGERLRKSGYLGVCGIDYISTPYEVYFSEINPRFQSSSFLLNLALYDNGQNYSIQHLHLDAFEHSKCQLPVQSLDVNYSYYKSIYSCTDIAVLKCLAERAQISNDVIYIDDDLSWNSQLEENTYLYKLIFKRNISAVSFNYNLIIHPNLLTNNQIANFNRLEENMLELKIMLLTHGITISSDVREYAEQTNGINYREFEALDLIVQNKYYINVPYQTNLTMLSPFQVKTIDKCLWLFYCDTQLVSVSIRGTDSIAGRISKDGIEYSDAAYLGNDRLRIYHRLGCYFKANSLGCGFCDLETDDRPLPFETIKEVIDAYNSDPDIRHYLIGGGSQAPQDDFKSICTIAKYLKNKNGKSIYLMSLPPTEENILKSLKNAGISEVSFNIEIYDREIAKLFMPGKGSIPLQTYINALQCAVKLWGNTGNVRTIFIVGLEPKDSLLKGIEHMCKIGVSPILSLFKPICGTPLSHLMPPADEEILDIVRNAQRLCEKYGISLGPSCPFCEDNTLKITI